MLTVEVSRDTELFGVISQSVSQSHSGHGLVAGSSIAELGGETAHLLFWVSQDIYH